MVEANIDNTAISAVLTTGDGYSIVGAFQEQSFNFEDAESNADNAYGGYIGDGGTKYYVADNGSDSIYQFNLSTAYDLDTASAQSTFDARNESGQVESLTFSESGDTMLIADDGGDELDEYDLSTDWDVTSASYTRSNTVPEVDRPYGATYADNGNKVFIASSDDTIVEVLLDNRYNISTMTTQNVLNVSDTGATFTQSVRFDDSGQTMYVTDPNAGTFTFALESSFDLSTASYTGAFEKLGDNPYDLQFADGGRYIFVTNRQSSTVERFKSEVDFLDTTDFARQFDVSAEDNSPEGGAFSVGGNSYYVAGSENAQIYQYDVPVEFDTSTISYNQSFDISAQEGEPSDVVFKPDGTKMYVTGTSGDGVYEYDLSTAYDISTATYNQTFDVSSFDGSPEGVAFDDSGSKMFIIGSANDNIYEFSLSTNYDVSTASPNDDFDVSGQDTSPTGLAFNNNGGRLIISGALNSTLYEYELDDDFDITTASYTGTSFDVSSEDTTPASVTFSTDTARIYVTGTGSANIYTYQGKAQNFTPPQGTTWRVQTLERGLAELNDNDIPTQNNVLIMSEGDTLRGRNMFVSGYRVN